MSSVDARLTRLEKSAARWRIAALSLAVVLGAGISMGQITLGGGTGGMRAPLVTAEKFIVNDSLTVNDANGKPRLSLSSAKDGAALQLMDKDGNTLLSISNDGKAANILVQDAQGKKLFAAP